MDCFLLFCLWTIASVCVMSHRYLLLPVYLTLYQKSQQRFLFYYIFLFNQRNLQIVTSKRKPEGS